MPRLEAVTVCVGYSDFLEATCIHNRQHLDRWTIVTTPDDERTQALCHRRNLDCIVTDDFRRDGDERPFNKGRGISRALNFFHDDTWCLHLDADIVLPRLTRQMLDAAHLDPECLYGADRINLFGWDEWQELLRSGYLDNQHANHLVAMPYGRRGIGSRIVVDSEGYTPIGYFQLWHSKHGLRNGWRVKDYPNNNSHAAHSDIKFALQWDRRKRILLPEFFVVHLDSAPSDSPKGLNWRGRTTPWFGPPGSGPSRAMAAKPNTAGY